MISTSGECHRTRPSLHMLQAGSVTFVLLTRSTMAIDQKMRQSLPFSLVMVCFFVDNTLPAGLLFYLRRISEDSLLRVKGSRLTVFAMNYLENS